ncbi:MAG: hypothetical protein Q8K75_07645 [Chlamydiales bacterium]|nr:hypothetical protein [Chlamydiales bacterium]
MDSPVREHSIVIGAMRTSQEIELVDVSGGQHVLSPQQEQISSKSDSAASAVLGKESGSTPKAKTGRSRLGSPVTAVRNMFQGAKNIVVSGIRGAVRTASVRRGSTRQGAPVQTAQATNAAARAEHDHHLGKLESGFNNVETQLKRLKGMEERFPDKEQLATRPNYQILQKKLTEAKGELAGAIVEMNNLPAGDKQLILKQFQLKFAEFEGNFTFSQAAEHLSADDSAGTIKNFLGDLGEIKGARAQLGAVDHSEAISAIHAEKGPDAKPQVTLLCPLMIDGMGDLGIAMNALNALKKNTTDVDLKLVVMVGSGHAASAEQMKKVKQMTANNPQIEIVEVPFSYQTGGPGGISKASPEVQEHMKQVLGKTDVLLNLPVDYQQNMGEVRELMPKESRVVIGTEYGLREAKVDGDGFALPVKKGLEDSKIESGPGKAVYLHEGKLSEDEIVTLLKDNPDAMSIIPTLATSATSQEAIDTYSKDNNLAVFYLNKDTPAKTTKLFFEQYLDIHKDDARTLNILGDIPPAFLADKTFRKQLHEKYGISEITVGGKGKETTTIKLSSKQGKSLAIHSGYGFPPQTFRAMSEFSLLSSKGFTNLMFAAGDGSFSDALSLMVNYSQNPEDPNFVASLPVFITRLPFHETSVKEMIQLCGDIGEPQLKEVFEKLSQFKNLETLSPEERSNLTQLMNSNEVRLGLARLAKNIASEHNFSRTIHDHVVSELGEVANAKKASAEAASMVRGGA